MRVSIDANNNKYFIAILHRLNLYFRKNRSEGIRCRVLKNRIGDEAKYTTFYSNSKAEAINNESGINDAFESIYNTTISNIQKYIGTGSSWIID